MATYQVRLLKKKVIAEDTQAFHFERPRGFTFKPGQAVEVFVDAPALAAGRNDSRAFSLVSAPSEEEIVVATRMRADSEFKQALRDLPDGARLGLDGPFGSLTLQSNAARPAVFLAGGIGITPFVSMLRHVAGEGLPHRITLFYSNRRPQDAAYLDELSGLAASNSNFTLVATMTGDAATWSGERGIISADLLRKYGAETGSAIHYVVGPPRMVSAMRAMLEQLGVSDDDIRSEDFVGY